MSKSPRLKGIGKQQWQKEQWQNKEKWKKKN